MGIIQKLLAIYAVILFLVMMLFSLPVLAYHMIATPGTQALKKNLYFLYHQFTPVFLRFIGVKLNIINAEILQEKQAYVIVANHRSAIDFIINAHATKPKIFRYLAKAELIKIPIFGYVVKKMCLLVDRSSKMSRARSMVDLRQHIKEGWSIFIYPEGGRNRGTDLIARFYDGAFRIAMKSKVPIAVQTVLNIKDVAPATTSIDLSPGTIHIYWDAPIWPDTDKPNDIQAYKDKVREIMEKRLSEGIKRPK